MTWNRWIPVFVVLLTAAFPINAAEPMLRNLDIRGLTIGGTTTLTIDGDDLGKAPRLLLPFKAAQTLKPGSTDKKAVFDVTLAADVEPGYHHLRVVTEGGVSLPVLIGVDRLPQQTIAAPIKQLPVALHGTVAGGAIVEAKFSGKAKQRVTIEVESQRLGGKLRPILHLYNAKKLQLGWSWGVPALFGDTRLEAELPEDGEFTVTLHDAEYAAPAPGLFRLRIGEWTYVDRVFPPAISRAQAATIQLLGAKAQPMSLPAVKSGALVQVPWPRAKGEPFSGPRPYVRISNHAEFVEQAKSDKLQEIPEGPAGISGTLATVFEEDRYRVAVTPGKKVRLEVFAERLGSPLDCALVIRNDKDAQLARGEDSPGTLDPILEYAVPAKVTSIVVGVVDAQGRGGPRGMYRLVVEPQGTTGDSVKLMTPLQRLSLAPGSRGIVPVYADRKGGYTGPIEVVADPPLPGLTLANATIPTGADGTLVTVEPGDSSAEPHVLAFRGRDDKAAVHDVVIKGHPLERLQPWMASEFVVARAAKPADVFSVAWRDLPEKAALVPAEKLLLPVQLTRPMGKTTVKLTLLTSQLAPLVNNQPDPNKSLRQDKLGDLAANVNTGDVTVLVPVELSAPVYDVTVQAELLDPAKKVLATAFTPVRRLPVNVPIALKLDGPNRREVVLDAKKGGVLKLQGKLERRAGLKTDVALTFTGLPAGAKAEAVTVKSDTSDFSVNVTFPPTIAAGEFTGIKLSGSYAPNPKTPNVRVRSHEVELTLVVKAAAR